jgi:hypothetical protein
MSTLILAVPYPGPAILPPELIDQIREILSRPLWEGSLVSIEPDKGVEVPAIREMDTEFEGSVCPDCQAETGWDDFHWRIFLAGLGDSDASTG